MSLNVPNNGIPPGASRGGPQTIAVGETRRLEFSQVVELRIADFGRSTLPQFADSRFVATFRGSAYEVTRVAEIRPLVGVEIALNLPQVISLFIDPVRKTSYRPDMKGAAFAVRRTGEDEFRVRRLTQGK